MAKFNSESFVYDVQRKMHKLLKLPAVIYIARGDLYCTLAGVSVHPITLTIPDIEEKYLLYGYKLPTTCKTLINMYMGELTNQILNEGTIKAFRFYK